VNEDAATSAVESASMGGTMLGELVITLARSLDAKPGDPALAREYRIAATQLQAAANGAAGDTFAAMLTALAAND